LLLLQSHNQAEVGSAEEQPTRNSYDLEVL